MSRSASRSTWSAAASGSRTSRLIVRLPVSIRLMTDGLRLLRAASSSSDSPNVVRKLRKRVRTRFSISSSSAITPPVLRISQGVLQFPKTDCIVARMSEHTPHTVERHCDVAVVGGSAAGLAAALQLGRQRRSVIVVDAGEPRNAPAAHMHGYLSRDGLPPSELTAIGREEVRSYGGEVLAGRASRVTRTDDGRFRLELVGGHSIVARRVLAATGLVDELPDVDGVAEHWGGDVIHCPFCHGYEVRDRRIVQIVTHPMGLHPTALLRQLSARLTVVVHDPL